MHSFYLSGPISERLIFFQDQMKIILFVIAGSLNSAGPTGHGLLGLMGNPALQG